MLLGLQDGADLVVERRRRHRVGERAADLEGDRALDAHSLNVEGVRAILGDGLVGAVETVKMGVPDPVGDEFVAGRDTVVGRVEEDFAWIHGGGNAASGEAGRPRSCLR